ncbi:MAG: SDR family oxidoreductase [Candidatus Paceibacterota bacterium]
MKTIVTGGAGFIGSHLVDLLMEDNHEVIVLDDLSSGKEDNIKKWLGNSSFSFYKVDVSEYEKIKDYFKDVDWVFHLAGKAEIVPSINDPLKYFQANVLGTISVLEASRKNKVKKFIYAASSSCYGIAKTFPTNEGAPIDPQYPYALTKYLGELIAFHYFKVYKLPVISLRLFNVYGPRVRATNSYGAMFPTFLAQKLNNYPMTIVGDGEQTRDFVFVKDVARAFLMSAESEIEGEVFNVGSGKTYSINSIVKLIGGDYTYIPKRPGEPDCTWADIRKIKEKLGWEPQVSLEEGVKIMLEHINDYKDLPLWTKEKIQEATKDWFNYLGK